MNRQKSLELVNTKINYVNRAHPYLHDGRTWRRVTHAELNGRYVTLLLENGNVIMMTTTEFLKKRMSD